jgi:hypothetical protein
MSLMGELWLIARKRATPFPRAKARRICHHAARIRRGHWLKYSNRFRIFPEPSPSRKASRRRTISPTLPALLGHNHNARVVASGRKRLSVQPREIHNVARHHDTVLLCCEGKLRVIVGFIATGF